MFYKFVLYFFATMVLVSCSVDAPVINPVNDTPFEFLPENWPLPKYRFTENQISKDRFELGRALFYETRLSRDNSISCAGCHIQNYAFAQTDHAFSHGVDNRVGTRNAPGLFNLAWHTEFMHDGAINHIEKQPLAPIANPIEMDENLTRVLEKLNALPKYKTLTRAAYNSDTLTSQRMLWAMTQFMGLIYAQHSKYDAVKNNTNGIHFTAAEQRGYDVFIQHCNACHREPLFSDFEYRSNGLAPLPMLLDSGRSHVTGLSKDKWKFKTPSLRNVALTYPYMHDGRFTTLDQCIEHYRRGNFNHENLDPLLKGAITLSEGQISDLKLFLNTLTDYTMIYDRRFSDPQLQP